MPQFLSRRHLIKATAFGLVLMTCSAAAAEDLILEVVQPGGRVLGFTREEVEKLGIHQVITSTPWHDTAVKFEGPLLRDVLAAAGIGDRDIEVKALNDYSAVIPATDPEEHPVILATRMNGSTMTVREHGPLFIIYPFDQVPSLKSEIYYARSVWQVTTISAK